MKSAEVIQVVLLCVWMSCKTKPVPLFIVEIAAIYPAHCLLTLDCVPAACINKRTCLLFIQHYCSHMTTTVQLHLFYSLK